MLRYIADKYHQWSTRGNKRTYYAPGRKRELLTGEREIVDDFHNLYYRAWLKGAGTIDISWMGYRALKCPLDAWVYQEIIFETKPDVIVETGTFEGGSALYMGHLCELIGHGRVISIDLAKRENLPTHARVQFWVGSSTAPEILARLTSDIAGKKVMVILDSDHAFKHVKEELRLYSPLVSQHCYLIVEDTNVNGHPTNQEHGPGPMEAVEDFMQGNTQFIVDRGRERFMMTLNPGGYLQKL
jgi:cephalosporin hydroxylase